MILHKYLLIAMLVLITGCTQLPVETTTSVPAVKKPVASKQIGWKKRQQLLVVKNRWNLTSKVAVTFKEDYWSFGLEWAQQNAQGYAMQIKNPLTGALVAKLTRTGAGVTLLTDDGKTHRSNDEERLLQTQSGISLPIKGMKHWVRGLSSPLYKVDKVVLDNLGRPLSLHQAGWKITYSRYASNVFSAMPKKMLISRDSDDLYLKMIVRKWQGI